MPERITQWLVFIGIVAIPLSVAFLVPALQLALHRKELRSLGVRKQKHEVENEKVTGLIINLFITVVLIPIGIRELRKEDWLMGILVLMFSISFSIKPFSKMLRRKNLGIYENGIFTEDGAIKWEELHSVEVEEKFAHFLTKRGVRHSFHAIREVLAEIAITDKLQFASQESSKEANL